MKTENTSLRLKKIMKERHLRQVDILELTKPYSEKYNVKVSKSDLSQYVSGLVEPGQDKLSLLGMALGVSEAWLMGYDVPIERDIFYTDTQSNADMIIAEEATYKCQNDSIELKLITEFKKLNIFGKKEAVNRVTELTYIPQYTDSISNSKHKNKYVPTEEDIRSLVARNGKKLTREEVIEFISDLFTDDDDEDNE